MRLSLPQAELQRGLARIQTVAEKRSSMPMLAHVLLRATDPQGLELIATDLELEVRGRHSAEVKEGGAITVLARKFFEIVRELPQRDVELTSSADARLTIRCDRSLFVLSGSVAEQFPDLMEVSPDVFVRIQAVLLSSMIERTLYAASTDESQYNLNGIYFQAGDGGKLRMVAADGHRLALIERTVAEGGAALPDGIILPRKALNEIKRLVDDTEADEIELGCTGNVAVMRCSGTTMIARMVEGEFPNYRQVIPESLPRQLTVEREPFQLAVRRVAVLAVERSRLVRFELTSGKLRILTSSTELGEATEEIDVDYSGGDAALGFNFRYVLDALNAFDAKEVDISFADELTPVRIAPPGESENFAIVMPMRL